LNNVQLADWAALNAANEEQLRNYQQQVEKLSRRKMQAMESAQKLVNEDLEQKYRLAKQQGDQAAEREIVNIQKVIADRMQREKNEAANRAAMWTAGGTAVGAAGGAILGGTLLPGVGAVPGAIAGAGFGAAAGGLASNVLGG
jgi:TolA-binding protein